MFVNLEPLVFAENFHPALWGGERWLVSAHSSSPSIVRGGAFDGRSLDSLVAEFGAALAGRRAQGHFPLLLKEIDARERLSVQVHPGAVTAALTGGEAKMEMWHVLSAEPGCMVYAGLKPGTTRAKLEAAAKTGDFEELLLRYSAAPGLEMFLPGGLVHVIGGGVRIFEVQQSSNTTYRLYDWARKDSSGASRPLHVAKALDSVDLDAVPVMFKGEFACPFFNFKPRSLSAPREVAANGDTFRVFYAALGAFKVESAAGELHVPAGEAVLIPAAVAARLTPDAPPAPSSLRGDAEHCRGNSPILFEVSV